MAGETEMTDSTSLFTLEGKLAVVTGGERGIGRALAVGLQHAGAKVAVLDLGEGREAGGFPVIECDVSDERMVEAALAKVNSRIGSPDILVNNAGIDSLQPASTYPTETWQRIIGVNLTGALFCARRVGSDLIAAGRSGRIINIASVLGHVAPSMQTAVAYSAAKSGLLGMTRALAVEWAAHRINVNAICPGFVVTDLTASRLADADYERRMKHRIPAGRFAQPGGLVSAAVFLASPAADLVTGHALNVDAGWMAA